MGNENRIAEPMEEANQNGAVFLPGVEIIFHIDDAYNELLRAMKTILRNVIAGMDDDKITVSHPRNTDYADFEGEGFMMCVNEDLSNSSNDLGRCYNSEYGFSRHERLKRIFTEIHQTLESIGESRSETGMLDEPDDCDDDTINNFQNTQSNCFDSHTAYQELVEIIYPIIEILGKAVKKVYFFKEGTDYLTLAHGEFILQRAKEILCDKKLKKTDSNIKNQLDNKIYLFDHEKVISFLRAISEMLNYEKPLQLCSLF